MINLDLHNNEVFNHKHKRDVWICSRLAVGQSVIDLIFSGFFFSQDSLKSWDEKEEDDDEVDDTCR